MKLITNIIFFGFLACFLVLYSSTVISESTLYTNAELSSTLLLVMTCLFTSTSRAHVLIRDKTFQKVGQERLIVMCIKTVLLLCLITIFLDRIGIKEGVPSLVSKTVGSWYFFLGAIFFFILAGLIVKSPEALERRPIMVRTHIAVLIAAVSLGLLTTTSLVAYTNSLNPFYSIISSLVGGLFVTTIGLLNLEDIDAQVT